MTKLLLRLFVKNYPQSESEAVRIACGKLAGFVGIACNVALFFAKLLIGILTGALSITADAINNLTDAASSVITLLGFRLSEKPADEEHPYGHARYEYLTGLAVAALILIIGAELAISSFQKVLTYFSSSPETASAANRWVVAAVLVLSIAVKLWMMLFNRTLGRHIHSAALSATAADARNDVISTAAVLLAYLLEVYTGWYIDGFMGLAVALFILWSGLGVARETISPLLGEAVDPQIAELVKQEMGAHAMILGYHDLMVHDYGPGRQFASIHVEISAKEDVMVAHELIDDIEMKFKQEHRIFLVIHYDPIATDDPELDCLREKVCAILQEIDPALSFHDLRMVRGTERTNLIFDVVVPFRLSEKRQEIKRRIDDGLACDTMKYVSVITFDFSALAESAPTGNH